MTKNVNFNSNSGMKLPLGNEDYSSFYSTIKTAGSKLSSTTLIIISIIIIFSIIAGFYYFYYVLPKMKASYRANSEQVPAGSQNNTAELLFFFADWCPHCKAAKPIWNDLKSEYETKTINGYQVIFTEIDCSNENAEVEQMMNKYNIEGFPTIKLLKDGQVIEYDAKPSKETLTQFLNTVL